MKAIRDRVEEYFTKWMLKVFSHPSLNGLHTEKELIKYAKWGAQATDFLLAVAMFIVMQLIFVKIYNTIGFERTIIVLLVILAFLLRNFLEIRK